MTAGSDPLGS